MGKQTVPPGSGGEATQVLHFDATGYEEKQTGKTCRGQTIHRRCATRTE